MGEIKSRLQEVNSPTVHNRRNFTTIGKVLEVNEKTNTCEIQYIDNLGYYKNQKNVFVKLFAPGFIGWFPKKNEYVNVQINEGNILITGPNNFDYNNKRSSVKKEKDILSHTIGDTMGGCLF